MSMVARMLRRLADALDPPKIPVGYTREWHIAGVHTSANCTTPKITWRTN